MLLFPVGRFYGAKNEALAQRIIVIFLKRCHLRESRREFFAIFIIGWDLLKQRACVRGLLWDEKKKLTC